MGRLRSAGRAHDASRQLSQDKPPKSGTAREPATARGMDDTFGQLGNGIASANGDTEVPAAVRGLSGVTAVAAGEEHSLALLSDGTVMSWGDNESDQLGDGHDVSTQSLSTVPVPVVKITGVRAVAAGSQHSLALLSNGTVRAWGTTGASSWPGRTASPAGSPTATCR